MYALIGYLINIRRLNLPYTLFNEKFPAISHKETRFVQLINDPILGNDEFGLLEMYCDEPSCDCRRVMFNVISRQQQSSVAYIAYGWESTEFYISWFGSDDLEIIKELKGPALNTMNPQSNVASNLIPHIEDVLKDKQYVERLIRHYNLFRESIEKEAARTNKIKHRQSLKPKHKKRKKRKRR